MAGEVTVGRQPIFNRDLKLVAYELLFRQDSRTATADVRDGDIATSRVIENTLYEIGFRNLVGDKPAFINLTRSFLVSATELRLRKDEVVLEILEDVDVDDALLGRLRELSAAGYTIALDDFIYDPRHAALIDIADIVKVDLSLVPRGVLPEHVQSLRSHRVKLLAEKIETREQLEHCRGLGFDLYQGYLLAAPDIVTLSTATPESGGEPDPGARRRR
jgi:EAL and modified HD-GYP domain-containing signal transduction protein